MNVDDGRAVWTGCAVAAGSTLLLTVLAAAVESLVNGPGDRNVAPPVLWAVGGGLGLCIAAGWTAWATRRIGPGMLAAAVGAVPYLVLLLVAYNDERLDLGDQLVGTIVVVVLPALATALLCAVVAAYGARISGSRQPRSAGKSVTT